MAELGRIISKDTVRFERWFDLPVEQVWDYLTTPNGLAAWLMPCDEGIREGALVELRGEAPDPQGNIHTNIGVVSEYVRNRVLAYSWFEAVSNAATFVRFELEQRDGRVLLTLTHSGIDPDWMPLVGAGWHTCFERLATAIQTGQSPSFESFMPQFQELIGKYTIAIAAAGIVVTAGGAPAEAGTTDNHADQAIRDARSRLLTKYDRAWKDTRELERQYDSLKRVSSHDADRELDQVNRDLNDKLRDLKDIELDIRDLEKAVRS